MSIQKKRSCRAGASGSALAVLLLSPVAKSIAGEAEYAVRWTPCNCEQDLPLQRLLAELKMGNVKTEHFSVQYAEQVGPYAPLKALGAPIVRVRTELQADGRTAKGQPETTLKYRADTVPKVGAANCPIPQGKSWEAERDVTWLPPWQPSVLAQLLPPGVQPDAGYTDWPVRARESVSCEAKGDQTQALKQVVPLQMQPCSARMTRHTDKGRGLKYEIWTLPDKRQLHEVSRKVREDNPTARNEFSIDAVLPLMLRAQVVPQVENKTELNKCPV